MKTYQIKAWIKTTISFSIEAESRDEALLMAYEIMRPETIRAVMHMTTDDYVDQVLAIEERATA